MTRKEIGKAIKAQMDCKGMTVSGIKQYARVQKPQTNGVIKGTKNYTIDTLISICDTLGLEIKIASKLQK